METVVVIWIYICKEKTRVTLFHEVVKGETDARTNTKFFLPNLDISVHLYLLSRVQEVNLSAKTLRDSFESCLPLKLIVVVSVVKDHSELLVLYA